MGVRLMPPGSAGACAPAPPFARGRRSASVAFAGGRLEEGEEGGGSALGASRGSRATSRLHCIGVTLLGTLFASVALAVASPRPAAACDPATMPMNDHCYSIGDFSVSNPPTQIAAGASDYVDLGCLGVPDQANNFNTDEMWADMFDGSWIEAGIITGATRIGDYTQPGFFVSWQQANVPGSNAAANEVLPLVVAPTNTWNNVQLWQDVAGRSPYWHAWTAGTGTVTPGPFTNNWAAVDLQAGLETTTVGGWNDAAATNLQYEDWTGAWHNYWQYRGSNTQLVSGGVGVTLGGRLAPGSNGPFYNGWTPGWTNWQFNFGMNWHGC